MDEGPIFAENFDLTSICMPVNSLLLVKYLKRARYDPKEIDFLNNGFTKGFSIGYTGAVDRRSESNNLPLRIGSRTQLWNKVIKEVKHKRVAGPYQKIPFQHYI